MARPDCLATASSCVRIRAAQFPLGRGSHTVILSLGPATVTAGRFDDEGTARLAANAIKAGLASVLAAFTASVGAQRMPPVEGPEAAD